MVSQALPERTNAPGTKVDVLIVGAGPAGASLACFLAYHGITGMLVSKDASTSITPRAHLTNTPTWECLRAIGLEDECRRLTTSTKEVMPFHIGSASLAGEEFQRSFSFGSDPHMMGEYFDNSPCEHGDLPQSKMEPILVRHAAQSGWNVRFSTEFKHFEQHEDRVESELQDLVTGATFRVTSKYLCGADGARSRVAEQLQLPFVTKGTTGLALNVRFEADMSHLAKNRGNMLHWVLRPDLPPRNFSVMAMNRTITPWTEWMMLLFAKPGVTIVTASEAEIMERVREYIGDDNIKPKLKEISHWRVNEVYAEEYALGRVLCLGDAVHRHPPALGLGSNTCVQDAFNLAWKLAFVLKGQAGPGLLATFNQERQPVGRQVVTKANESLRTYNKLWTFLHTADPDLAARARPYALLREDSAEGAAARREFRDIVRVTTGDKLTLPHEVNHVYASSAVCAADEAPGTMRGFDWEKEEFNQRVWHTTQPGFRVPHAWLGVGGPGGPQKAPVSTRDLTGYGHFTLLTGVGGVPAWDAAARGVMAALSGKVEVRVHGIGWGQEYEDTFFRWDDVREVGEKGAVLVRPDKFVCWRSKEALEATEAESKLVTVLKEVLSLA